MGVMNQIKLIENCEEIGNSFTLHHCPVARTNIRGDGNSRVTVALSCDRDSAYFWHHFVSGWHVDFGSASDGTDVSGRACFQTGPAVSALGLGRFYHTSYHRPADVRLGGHEDVRQLGVPDQDADDRGRGHKRRCFSFTGLPKRWKMGQGSGRADVGPRRGSHFDFVLVRNRSGWPVDRVRLAIDVKK